MYMKKKIFLANDVAVMSAELYPAIRKISTVKNKKSKIK